MTSTRRGPAPAESRNIDDQVVDGFGDEWTRFDQSALSAEEVQEVFDAYFAVFPWNDLPPLAVGFDLGCGSARWARLVAPRVGRLHCIDASAAAIEIARRALAGHANCELYVASVDQIPLPDGSADFGYSLGVLHHVPDTRAGLRDCVLKLKPGAPFLVYLYYRFDNRPRWYAMLWRTTELARHVVSRMPKPLRYAISQILAATVYWPLARLARLGESLGLDVGSFPMSFYRDRSFYVMRTDALDRFGTQLEQRFTRAEIQEMMLGAGLTNIVFSEGAPFWCAVGRRSS